MYCDQISHLHYTAPSRHSIASKARLAHVLWINTRADLHNDLVRHSSVAHAALCVDVWQLTVSAVNLIRKNRYINSTYEAPRAFRYQRDHWCVARVAG